MNKYPAAFPKPDHTAIGGEVGVGLQRTTVPVAYANQEKRFNAPEVLVTLGFSMNNDAVVLWLNWMFENAYQWFAMDIVGPYAPRDIFSEHRVRLVSEIDQRKAGDNWYTVRATFEVVPADRPDPYLAEPAFDWVVASKTATDDIEAGAPGSAATDVIRSHLYYWDR